MKKELSSAIDYLTESSGNHAVGESDIREAVEILRGLFYQHLDLKKYLKERTDEIELDLLAIRHTGCGEGAVKGQKGKLEAYQEILNYLSK